MSALFENVRLHILNGRILRARIPRPRLLLRCSSPVHPARVNPSPSMKLNRFVRLSCVLTAVPVCFTHAQTAPPPASQPPDVVELSPFVVNTDQDVGYLAGNTLAGSRLNTALKD